MPCWFGDKDGALARDCVPSLCNCFTFALTVVVSDSRFHGVIAVPFQWYLLVIHLQTIYQSEGLSIAIVDSYDCTE